MPPSVFELFVAPQGVSDTVRWTGWGLLRESTHVLMEGTPRGLDRGKVTAVIAGVPGVVDVHHLHLWNLASDVPAASAHVVLSGQPTLREAQRTADDVRATLAEEFTLTNVTLELEDTTAPSVDRADPSSRVASP